jgi:hypothetical protein
MASLASVSERLWVEARRRPRGELVPQAASRLTARLDGHDVEISGLKIATAVHRSDLTWLDRLLWLVVGALVGGAIGSLM